MTLKTIASWYRRQPRWVQKLLIGVDILLGNKFWHDKDNKTVSEHLAEDKKDDELDGKIGCAILDLADPGHCERADTHSH